MHDSHRSPRRAGLRSPAPPLRQRVSDASITKARTKSEPNSAKCVHGLPTPCGVATVSPRKSRLPQSGDLAEIQIRWEAKLITRLTSRTHARCDSEPTAGPSRNKSATNPIIARRKENGNLRSTAGATDFLDRRPHALSRAPRRRFPPRRARRERRIGSAHAPSLHPDQQMRQRHHHRCSDEESPDKCDPAHRREMTSEDTINVSWCCRGMISLAHDNEKLRVVEGLMKRNGSRLQGSLLQIRNSSRPPGSLGRTVDLSPMRHL